MVSNLGGEGGKNPNPQSLNLPYRCCQLHDTCYDNLLSYRCHAKMQGYRYGWHSGSPSCSK